MVLRSQRNTDIRTVFSILSPGVEIYALYVFKHMPSQDPHREVYRVRHGTIRMSDSGFL